MATLSINSDNVIELRNLKDTISGNTITTATVTVTLVDSNGTEVTGATWPLSMPHIVSGLYRAILPNELVLSNALTYVATVVADNGDEQHKEWCVNYSATCR
jgi:hypothetical protein